MIVNAASLFTTLKMKIVKQFVMSTIGIQGWGAEGAAVTRPPSILFGKETCHFLAKSMLFFGKDAFNFWAKVLQHPHLEVVLYT